MPSICKNFHDPRFVIFNITLNIWILSMIILIECHITDIYFPFIRFLLFFDQDLGLNLFFLLNSEHCKRILIKICSLWFIPLFNSTLLFSKRCNKSFTLFYNFNFRFRIHIIIKRKFIILLGR